MKFNVSFFALLVCNTLLLSAQQERRYPVVGEPCPDFVLQDVRYYKAKQVSLSDFKGKWLLLDLWSKGCSGCIKQFPKMDTLNELYKNKLQVLLVGRKGSGFDKDVDVLFDKIKAKQGLRLPVAFDSLLFEQFGIMGVPAAILIDPKSVVRAVTYTVTHEKIANLLDGLPVRFEHKPNKFEASEQDSIRNLVPVLADALGDIVSGSYISLWKNESQKRAIYPMEATARKNFFALQGANVIDLYRFAYIGKSSWWYDDSLYYALSSFPALELEDTSPFDDDIETGRGYYNYYLRVPAEKASLHYIKEIMKEDLRKLFGYEVSFEKRSVPCWKLKASDLAQKKLVTKNGEKTFYSDLSHLKLINVPVQAIINFIKADHQLEPVLVDETGISSNIDISMEVILSDFEDVKKQLQKQGLTLEKGETVMTVMVFRDGNK